MSDPELPTFVGQIAGWLENEDNNEVIQQLRKGEWIVQLPAMMGALNIAMFVRLDPLDTGIKDLQVQQYKIKKDLELQERLRPELRKIPGFWPFALVRMLG
jgi:hypothetical protein